MRPIGKPLDPFQFFIIRDTLECQILNVENAMLPDILRKVEFCAFDRREGLLDYLPEVVSDGFWALAIVRYAWLDGFYTRTYNAP